MFATPLALEPVISGPGELFCQWADDAYTTPVLSFDLTFGPSERAARWKFDAEFRRASASLPEMMPASEAFMASAAGSNSPSRRPQCCVRCQPQE